MKPLAIDLFTGLHGWTEGLVAEGFEVVGFDLEDMSTQFGQPKPAHFHLVIQNVLTLHGRQFKDAALIVASPPCQAYSYRAMPWKRAKALPPPDNTLFDACFRIQREACEAAGRHIPLIVENVRGAQPWVGRSRWNVGGYHLWGDVPAVMPIERPIKQAGKPGAGKDGWFYGNYENSARRWASSSPQRKEWSATIAKIPLPLARWIGRCYHPSRAATAAPAAT
jgi:C-5 cytosine-specific DNA methylase